MWRASGITLFYHEVKSQIFELISELLKKSPDCFLNAILRVVYSRCVHHHRVQYKIVYFLIVSGTPGLRLCINQVLTFSCIGGENSKNDEIFGVGVVNENPP